MLPSAQRMHPRRVRQRPPPHQPVPSLGARPRRHHLSQGRIPLVHGALEAACLARSPENTHHLAQVVQRGESRAHNGNVAFPQPRQGPAHAQMLFWVFRSQHRDLNHGYVGLRIDKRERHEDAVVPAARAVEARRQAVLLEETLDLGGDGRIALGGVLDSIGLGREAVVVVEEVVVSS
ncbi:hypothetical protein E4U42_007105 [Claviceps africana]|uniref:Uncharacterized protein n=1 Tax=Claviceps africana TaxID=83212 RepID=A0A8K0J2E2_9HYPO|nr:hypothetical protein E4U42_007105 [Claviceps africana]